ncbi:uncharacterized protein PAC_04904 [Phialocephala subalpina]|uniref:SET domain-containing protein n=1 Tax=Phialocephala subalpina TaxID=576137 RepID=A0A1L7WQI4_9HELO|nr:uncharacterized protein PAC_04904 [Phialocephala subalpina]
MTHVFFEAEFEKFTFNFSSAEKTGFQTLIEDLAKAPQPEDALANGVLSPPKDDDKKIAIEAHELDLDFDHNFPRPDTPELAPANISPSPVRYPETLCTIIQICEIEGKGLGIVAAKDIPQGTFLLVETPIFVLLKSQTDAAIEATVDALSPENKEKFFSLSAYMSEEGESLKCRIMDCNAFSIMDETTSGVFETASRINHSCVPNSQYGWRDSIGRLVVWNRFKLLEGEEVTIDYGHRKNSLWSNYGFECTCGRCTDGESEDEK